MVLPFSLKSSNSYLIATFLFLGLTIVPLFLVKPVLAQSLEPLNPRDMNMKISGEFTFASVGDLMIRRPASQLADADVQAALQLISEADLSFGNMEGELGNLREFEGPLNGFMGTHEVAADLKVMGLDNRLFGYF